MRCGTCDLAAHTAVPARDYATKDPSHLSEQKPMRLSSKPAHPHGNNQVNGWILGAKAWEVKHKIKSETMAMRRTRDDLCNMTLAPQGHVKQSTQTTKRPMPATIQDVGALRVTHDSLFTMLFDAILGLPPIGDAFVFYGIECIVHTIHKHSHTSPHCLVFNPVRIQQQHIERFRPRIA